MSGFSESPLRQLSPPVPFYPDLLSILHRTVSAADKAADTQTDSLLPVAAILPLLSEARLSFAASVSVALKVLVSDLPDFLPALSVVPADFLML